MLREIFRKQRELQERLGTDFHTMSEEECANFMRNHRGFLEDELAEALYEMPYYKPWKDYSNMTAEEKAAAWEKVHMELVDALHFFVNMMLASGLTADRLYGMYMSKNKENHRRQDEGYTSDVSYRDQQVDKVFKVDAAFNFEPTCTVMMDDTYESSDDFVAVLHMNDGRTALRYNTDTLSLGLAIKVLAKEYFDQLSKLNEADRTEVEAIIGDVTHKEATNG